MLNSARSRTTPILLALTIGACGGADAPAPEPAAIARTESPELELAIATVPAAFTVVENEGDRLRLEAVEVDAAEVTIAVGPLEPTGINLVEEVKQRRTAFEAEGLYFGNRELMTPHGPAFTARGQLPGTDDPTEETWVYSLHPDGSDRLLTVVYRYPAGGDSQARVGELLELLGEIEPL